MIDLKEIRAEYPILDRKIYDRPLVYLDSAATSQTPRCVLDCINDMYTTKKANVHRGVHTLSQEATELQERTREKVRAYINAASTQEIIFTRGTTEAINLVASSFGDEFLHDGDEVILTVMEHHADILPEGFPGHLPGRYAVQHNLPGLGIIKAHQQVNEGERYDDGNERAYDQHRNGREFPEHRRIGIVECISERKCSDHVAGGYGIFRSRQFLCIFCLWDPDKQKYQRQRRCHYKRV